MCIYLHTYHLCNLAVDVLCMSSLICLLYYALASIDFIVFDISDLIRYFLMPLPVTTSYSRLTPNEICELHVSCSPLGSD